MALPALDNISPWCPNDSERKIMGTENSRLWTVKRKAENTIDQFIIPYFNLVRYEDEHTVRTIPHVLVFSHLFITTCVQRVYSHVHAYMDTCYLCIRTHRAG